MRRGCDLDVGMHGGDGADGDRDGDGDATGRGGRERDGAVDCVLWNGWAADEGR